MKVCLVFSTNVAAQCCTHVVLSHTYRIHTLTISNFATGQFVDVNIQSLRLIEVPKLVKLEKRNAGMVGLGLHV